MSRNKYPEETVEKILNVSEKLFTEKGYENTSIQDIIDQLGGLTKGAIYHHFKSKEDIMLAVIDRKFIEHDARWLQIMRSQEGMSGLEKLRELLLASIVSPKQSELFQSAPRLLDNPKMLTLQLKSIKDETAPMWIEPVIREGIEDGSIKTGYPKELAEVILLLINMWLTPFVFWGSKEEIMQRVKFFQHLLESLGLELIDENMISKFDDLINFYYIHDK